MVSEPGWGSKENRPPLRTAHRGPAVLDRSLYSPHLFWQTSFLCFCFLGNPYGYHIYSGNLLPLCHDPFLLSWKVFRSSSAIVTFSVIHCPGGPVCSSPIFQRAFYAFLATYKPFLATAIRHRVGNLSDWWLHHRTCLLRIYTDRPTMLA